jgi:hypothetical protein
MIRYHQLTDMKHLYTYTRDSLRKDVQERGPELNVPYPAVPVKKAKARKKPYIHKAKDYRPKIRYVRVERVKEGKRFAEELEKERERVKLRETREKREIEEAAKRAAAIAAGIAPPPPPPPRAKAPPRAPPPPPPKVSKGSLKIKIPKNFPIDIAAVISEVVSGNITSSEARAFASVIDYDKNGLIRMQGPNSASLAKKVQLEDFDAASGRFKFGNSRTDQTFWIEPSMQPWAAMFLQATVLKLRSIGAPRTRRLVNIGQQIKDVANAQNLSEAKARQVLQGDINTTLIRHYSFSADTKKY